MIDVRLPIGWLFAIFGVLVTARGMWSPIATPMGTQSINLDLIWGIIMLGFGLIMLLLVRRSKGSQ